MKQKSHSFLPEHVCADFFGGDSSSRNRAGLGVVAGVEEGDGESKATGGSGTSLTHDSGCARDGSGGPGSGGSESGGLRCDGSESGGLRCDGWDVGFIGEAGSESLASWPARNAPGTGAEEGPGIGTGGGVAGCSVSRWLPGAW